MNPAAARWAALAPSIPAAVMAEARSRATAAYYKLALQHGHRFARRTLESGLADLPPPSHDAEAVAPIVAAAQLLLELK